MINFRNVPCETYGKISVVSKLIKTFKRKDYYEYTTIDDPTKWKVV